MWSAAASLGPVATALGANCLVRERYLATEEVVATDIAKVRSEVGRLVVVANSEPAIGHLTDRCDLDVVVWVGIIADEGTVSIDDLGIDMTPFGCRIGLVVENFAEVDASGIPVKLLIGPAASRGSA